MPAAIEFYFDFISPNAYLAWTQIHPVAARYERPLVLKPILFAGLLKEHDRLGPGELPVVRRWMFENCVRKARRLGIPLNPPAAHPFNPLLALRLVSLDFEESPKREIIDRLFELIWVDGAAVDTSAALIPILEDLDLDSSEWLAAAIEPDNKRKLAQATQQAIELGVFGVPTMRVDGECFWGFDDFPQMTHFLETQDRIPLEESRRWKAIRPSARRAEHRE